MAADPLAACCSMSPTPLATPLATLTIDAVHASLRPGAQVESVVKKTLRHGTREGLVSNAAERSVVASTVFGTTVLRARLAYMLSSLKRREPSVGADIFGSHSRTSSLLLLSLFLLHEKPQRVSIEAVRELMPPASLGLPEPTLQRLAALDVNSIEWPAAVVPGLAARYSLPCGLARIISAQLPPGEAAALAGSFNRPGPVNLRANLRVLPSGREALIASLSSLGVACRPGLLSPWSVILESEAGRSAWGGSVWNLPAWKEGAFEVQDEGSQCIVAACEAAPGDSVLDLCAGNGGKALALAALVGSSGSLLAHDVVPKRLAAIRASAERARVGPIIETVASSDEGGERGDGAACGGAVPRVADALTVASRKLAPSGHDLVLVDAPCSSSGTLRRHPGLRWSGAWGSGGCSAAATERSQLPALQRRLLHQAAAHTKPGGRLVYATCSLDPSENAQVADAFESQYADRQLEPWPFAEGVPGVHEHARHHRTLWPHRHGTDGFFIARWRMGVAVGEAAGLRFIK